MIRKILFIIFTLVCLSAAAYLFYLNEIVLPEKIKTTLITGLEQSTGKHVFIGSAKIDILKGLVIKDLVVSEDKTRILSAKNISCRFLIIPLFKKEAVITSIKFDSPQVLLERLPDNSINIVELFFKKPVSFMDGKFGLTISRIIISRGDIVFKDDTFEEPFTKDIKNADIDVRLMLPDKVVFNAEFGIPSQIMMAVKSSGEYTILKKELSARIEVKDFYPKDFLRYCDEKRFKIPDGRVDAGLMFDYRDGIINTDMDISGMDMKFSEGKIEANLNGTITAKTKYNIQNKELIYTGTAIIKNLALQNLDVLDNIYDIRGQVFFSDKTFLFKEITATVLGLPVKATAQIKDVQNPVLDISVVSDVNLYLLKDILKSKFEIDMPLQMYGQGRLNLALRYKDFADKEPLVNGSLDMTDAVFKSQYAKNPIDGVTGKIDFTPNQLIFKDLRLKYNKADYVISGTVTNFQKPGVQLELRSDRLFAKALFSVNDTSVALSALAGRYDDYIFSMQGDINTSDPKDMKAILNGSLRFELSEKKEPYKGIKDKFKDLKLAGDIKADFMLKGNLNDIQNSFIDAEVKCNDLVINKLEMKNFTTHFMRRNNVCNIEYFRAHVYGGTIDGNGLIDFAAKDTPYRINAEMKSVKIEELKKDTPFKDKDISGIIQTRFGINGFSNDSSRFNAWGKINISKGKLWQLNLFKGIGTLLFRSDFGYVLFEEGSCDFVFKDKSFYINDLVMKSSLLNLLGTVKISEDKTIAASLRAEFTDEGVDAARASNIAGAIERYSVIEVKGTFDEPEYKIRPDLSNVMSDIADNFFSQ